MTIRDNAPSVFIPGSLALLVLWSPSPLNRKMLLRLAVFVDAVHP